MTVRKTVNDDRIDLRVSGKLKKRYFKHCEKLGVNPSERLRDLMLADMKG